MPTFGAANYEIRYSNDIASSDWSAAVLLWSGSALAWSDTQPRTGRYLIKALSAAPGTVESVHAASYSFLESGSRLDLLGLAAGQTPVVVVIANAYNGDGTCSATLSCIDQFLNRPDGTIARIVPSPISWASNLAPSTTYLVYTYLRLSDFTLHSAVGDGVVPDTATNDDSAAFCSLAGNYPGPVVSFTTPTSSGSVGVTSPTFDVITTYNPGDDSTPAFLSVTGVDVTYGGSGQVAATAILRGRLVPGAGPGGSYDSPFTLTLSGGVVVGTSGCNESTEWNSTPSVVASAS